MPKITQKQNICLSISSQGSDSTKALGQGVSDKALSFKTLPPSFFQALFIIVFILEIFIFSDEYSVDDG